MHDNIPDIGLCLLFALILIIWISFDHRARALIARDAAAGAVAVAGHAVAMASAGECARAWTTDEPEGCRVHLCARPFEHDGPCDCGVCSEPNGIDR